MATAASADGVPVFKFKSWRLKGVARPEVIKVIQLYSCLRKDVSKPLKTQVLAEYKSVGADLNVMPYCSQFIPLEVVNHPQHK